MHTVQLADKNRPSLCVFRELEVLRTYVLVIFFHIINMTYLNQFQLYAQFVKILSN